MYILTPGFQGFTKHSRSSELFGAQNCNTFGHFSSQFSGICISKLLRMESASQPTIVQGAEKVVFARGPSVRTAGIAVVWTFPNFC